MARKDDKQNENEYFIEKLTGFSHADMEFFNHFTEGFGLRSECHRQEVFCNLLAANCILLRHIKCLLSSIDDKK